MSDFIVIDNGSGMCKAGFAKDSSRSNSLRMPSNHPRSVSDLQVECVFGAGFGEDRKPKPKVQFPAVVGRPKNKDKGDTYVGDEAQQRRDALAINYPIVRGLVTNWDDMEKIWQHIYNELRADPKSHPVLHSESLLNPKPNREKMTQIMFETFASPAINLGRQTNLAMTACGVSAGVLVESGDGVTYVVASYENYALPKSIVKLDLAGRDMTDYLRRILNEKGIALTTAAERKHVNAIKETYCQVALDYNKESQSDVTMDYFLPDGQKITIGNERFRCPETMFNPHHAGSDYEGIQEAIYSSIMRCDHDIHKHLYPSIICSGGNTMFPGFGDRLRQELINLVRPDAAKMVHVTSASDVVGRGDHAVWLGGAALASRANFKEEFCIVKSEYEEYGPSIVHRKCV